MLDALNAYRYIMFDVETEVFEELYGIVIKHLSTDGTENKLKLNNFLWDGVQPSFFNFSWILCK